MGDFLSGSNGGTMQAAVQNPAQDIANRRASIWLDPYAAESLKNYANGTMTSDQALETPWHKGTNMVPEAFFNALATSALTGSKYATEQVQKSPILGQLFGNEGQLKQATDEATRLQNQGYKIQPEDVEAYGQASGNISRLYGKTENALAQSLANRGFAGAPAGLASAQFTGLTGNKNEQLARAQTDIADRRMQNTLNRLGQTRNYITALGSEAENSINNQYNRALAGQNSEQGNLAQTSAGQTARNQAENQANLAASEWNKAQETGGLLGAMQQGLFTGVQSGIASQVGGSISGSNSPGKQMMGGGGGQTSTTTQSPSGSPGQNNQTMQSGGGGGGGMMSGLGSLFAFI